MIVIEFLGQTLWDGGQVQAEGDEGRKVKMKTKRNGGGEVRMVLVKIEQEGKGNSRALNRNVESKGEDKGDKDSTERGLALFQP